MGEDALLAIVAAILKAGSQMLDADCRLNNEEAVANARQILAAATEEN